MNYYVLLHLSFVDDSINFTRVASANRAYIVLISLSVFIIQLGTLNLLRYNRTIAVLAATLKASAKDLANVGICLFVLVMGFTAFATIYYGTLVYEYRSFVNTFTTLVSAFIGKFEYTSVRNATNWFGGLMLILYLLILLYFMMNLFITVLNDFLAAIQNDPEACPEVHEVITHLLTIVKSSVGMESEQKSKEIAAIMKASEDTLYLVPVTLYNLL